MGRRSIGAWRRAITLSRTLIRGSLVLVMWPAMLTCSRIIRATHGRAGMTSWSTDREVAEGFAGKNGVILQTTIEEMQARGVNIFESPDCFEESEILLEGRIGGLQVTQP